MARRVEVLLRQKRNEINQADVARELELLSVMWRGDAIELKTLSVLAKIYSDTSRYSDAFAATRAATRLQPNSPESRQAQDSASALFTQLFLGPKGDEMPAVQAGESRLGGTASARAMRSSTRPKRAPLCRALQVAATAITAKAPQ